MRGIRSLLPSAFLLLSATFLSGCLEPEAAAVDAELMDGHGHGAMAHGEFQMTATDCEEGGFVAAYAGEQKYAGVWLSADIRDEIGTPVHDSIGRPVTGPLFGNWHMGFNCATATHGEHTEKNYIFGRVGQMIEAPSWDPGGADLHFITTGWAMDNGTIGEAMRAATTADITHAYVAETTWLIPKETPRSFAYAVFKDAEKGVYEGIGDMEYYREAPARTIRFWWQVPADGSESHAADHHGTPSAPVTGNGGESGKWNPVYWDLTTTGGPQYVTPDAGFEVAFHNRGLEGMQEHGVPTQPCMTNVYEHKSLTLTYGEVIEDVTLTEIWTH